MKVTGYVYVRGEHGESVLLSPGDRVPEGVIVTNEDVLEADAHILPAPPMDPAKVTDRAPARKRTAPKE